MCTAAYRRCQPLTFSRRGSRGARLAVEPPASVDDTCRDTVTSE